jgi:hypothetical protein
VAIFCWRLILASDWRIRAVYFNVPLDPAAIAAGLADLALTLTEASKIRLRVELDGRFTLEAEPLARAALPQPLRVGWPRAGGFRRDLAVSQNHPTRDLRDRPRQSARTVTK